jgi:choline dehydrogenase-like flavoprotein
MLIDAHTLGGGETIEADVCIAGAGPAGLAVALELGAAGVAVVLIERGSDSLDGEVDGTYPSLESTRAGGLGGSAALWDAELAPGRYGARYAPLAPIDFEARDGVPLTGWPLHRQQLDPWYERAHVLCDAGPFRYESDGAVAPFGDTLACDVFRFGLGTVFTVRHRKTLERSADVRVIEPATVVGLETARGFATELLAAVARGHVFGVRARAYVLALGGIENARFLLLTGLGNEHDLVGRFLMDHPTARCLLEGDEGSAKRLQACDVRERDGHSVLRTITLPEPTLVHERLLSSGFFIVPARDRELRAVEAARALLSTARHGRLPANAGRTARNILGGLDAIALAGHRRLVAKAPFLQPTARLSRRAGLLNTLGVGPISGWSTLRGRPRRFDVYHVVEQAPEWERRVTLSRQCDDLGRPVAKVRFFVSQRELVSLGRTEELFAAALSRAGLGRLRTARELAPGGAVASVLHPSAHHHLGTTRMHADPRFGVVDSNSRLHSLRNVFLAGGSVFPTSGYVNPTLTIVALAARLGAHLREVPT